MSADPDDGERPTIAPFFAALAIIVVVVIAIGLFNIFRGDTCRARQDTESDILARQRDSVAKHGARFVDDVTDVAIDGDRATATVIYHFDKAPDTKTGVATTFVREDGAWKVCSTGPN